MIKKNTFPFLIIVVLGILSYVLLSTPNYTTEQVISSTHTGADNWESFLEYYYNATNQTSLVETNQTNQTSPEDESPTDLLIPEEPPAPPTQFESWDMEFSGEAYALEVQKIRASDVGRDSFGYSVSISGEYAIIGAYRKNVVSNMEGAAYIFKNISGNWTQTQRLTASDPSALAHFGNSVSMSGDYAVVGAMDFNGGRGAAYIFKNNGTNWTQVQKIVISGGQINNQFARSVSMYGDYMIISAPNEANVFAGAGSVYVFKNLNGIWTQVQRIGASDPGSTDGFGHSVYLFDDFIIAGSVQEDPGGTTDAGSAYIFENIGGTWTQVQKVYASDKGASDYFGWSVSLFGDYALVGAYSEDPGGIADAGSAYIFMRNSSGGWEEVQKIQASDYESLDNFGWSVLLSENYALVGAYREGAGAARYGAVYVFNNTAGTWTQIQKIRPNVLLSSLLFGSSLSVSGNDLIVGAAGDDTGDIDAGSAYVFDLNFTDTYPPVITVYSAQNTSVGANHIFRIFTSEGTNCSLYLDGVWYANASVGLSHEWTQVLSETNHTGIYFRCMDVAGNKANSILYWLDVDATPPMLSWSWTDINSTINSKRTLICVNSSELINCTLNLNGTIYENSTQGTEVCWQASNLRNGNYSNTYALCDDELGNGESTSFAWVNVILPKIIVSRVKPNPVLTNIEVAGDELFEVVVNVSCQTVDCGEINVSLDPPAETYVWQNASLGAYIGPTAWSYIMGYRFSPESDTQVTELCKYTASDTTVKLYDSAFTELGSALVTGSAPWQCTELGSPISISSSEDYYVVACLQGTGGYYQTPAALPRAVNGVYVYESQYQSSAGCTFTGGSTQTTNMYGLADIGIGTGAGSKNGLVPMDYGSPFYTATNNPYTINLSDGESQIVTWSVNANATLGTNHTFYVYANLTRESGISNLTDSWNVSIVSGSVPSLSWNWTDINSTISASNSSLICINASESVNCTLWINATAYTNSTSAPRVCWSPELANGNYTLKATCDDQSANNANTTTAWLNVSFFSFDTTPPTLSWNWTDINSIIINNYTTICVNASETVNCTLRINGTNYINGTSATNICWRKELANGNYTLNATCDDTSGNNANTTNAWISVDTSILFTLTKTANTSVVTTGHLINWTITVNNTGLSAINITLNDSNGQNFSITDLVAGDNYTISYTTNASCDDINNTVNATAINYYTTSTANATFLVSVTSCGDGICNCGETASSCSIDCKSSGGGSSCNKPWKCTPWTKCIDGKKTRECDCNCADDDDCNGNSDEEKSCGPKNKTSEEGSEGTPNSEGSSETGTQTPPEETLPEEKSPELDVEGEPKKDNKVEVVVKDSKGSPAEGDVEVTSPDGSKSKHSLVGGRVPIILESSGDWTFTYTDSEGTIVTETITVGGIPTDSDELESEVLEQETVAPKPIKKQKPADLTWLWILIILVILGLFLFFLWKKKKKKED